LRHNARQSLLTAGIVSTSVTLIIFLTALISGLERRLLTNVTDAIAHIIIRPTERLPIPAWKLPANKQADVLYVGETIKLEQRKRKIEE
jgi:ABC-type lipoprotein release transport system permease subunit